MIPRHLVDPQCPTSRPSIPMPSPLDVALAPQLLAVALAQAALAATHRALENAHPILAATSRHPQNLAASEHFAILFFAPEK